MPTPLINNLYSQHMPLLYLSLRFQPRGPTAMTSVSCTPRAKND
uniref:Uncharacterized protein n=1 Tax=Ciona intestinalis TaxID=7719 RepID=H2XYC5_CIOIN